MDIYLFCFRSMLLLLMTDWTSMIRAINLNTHSFFWFFCVRSHMHPDPFKAVQSRYQFLVSGSIICIYTVSKIFWLNVIKTNKNLFLLISFTSIMDFFSSFLSQKDLKWSLSIWFQDLLFLTCSHPENRNILTKMEEWPEWILEVLISNYEVLWMNSVVDPRPSSLLRP